MNILVTGAKGMVGTALVNNLKNIKENKNRTRPSIHVDEIYEYDIQSTEAELDACCKSADFVFHLAGVNRPENPEDFMQGNFGLHRSFWIRLKSTGIKRQSCCRLPFRQHWPEDLEIPNMVVQRRREKSFSFNMRERPVPKLPCIVFLI